MAKLQSAKWLSIVKGNICYTYGRRLYMMINYMLFNPQAPHCFVCILYHVHTRALKYNSNAEMVTGVDIAIMIDWLIC